MNIINCGTELSKLQEGFHIEAFMRKKVLVIDDDHEVGALIETVLDADGCDVYHAYSGIEGLKQTYQVHPDIIVLDIMMPDMDGFTVCSRLREMVSTPILMLTALSSEKDMIRGFNVGVDDFLRKPFNNNELKARVRALLRRASQNSSGGSSQITSYVDPFLEIDIPGQHVKLAGNEIELSPKEFEILACLVRQSGKVLSHHELVREVWGSSYLDTKPMAALYIFYLRKKLQDGKNGHQYIRTFWGRGYWFSPLGMDNQ